MNRRVMFGAVSVLVTVLILGALAVAVGGMAYRAGVMHGLAQNPVIVAPDGTSPDGGPGLWYYHGGPMMWRGGWGWGGGLGFLQCLIPLFFIFVLVMLLRLMFWRGPWGWRRGWAGPGHPGWDREKGYPPMFEEWHRRMHDEEAKTEGGKQ